MPGARRVIRTTLQRGQVRIRALGRAKTALARLAREPCTADERAAIARLRREIAQRLRAVRRECRGIILAEQLRAARARA